VKQTLVRVVVLLVTMGLGVVKWTLGPVRVKIGVLAAFYMLFSFIFQMIKEIQAVAEKNMVNNWITFFVIVPKAILDIGFVYWVFLSIIRTMQQLTLRHQTLKLSMYKRFFIVLVATGILAVGFLLYQLYLSVTKSGFPWMYEWMIDSYFDTLFLGVLVGLAILWRARSNNTRYGYAEFFQEENDGDELKEDTERVVGTLDTVTVSGTEITQRKKSGTSSQPNVSPQRSEGYENDREKNIEKSKYKLTEFDKDIMSIELSDDGEDGDIGIEAQLRKMD